jgi:hypothetical protein
MRRTQQTPNKAINMDAQTASFAVCLADRYLERLPLAALA